MWFFILDFHCLILIVHWFMPLLFPFKVYQKDRNTWVAYVSNGYSVDVQVIKLVETENDGHMPLWCVVI